jgi:hypothetical protein
LRANGSTEVGADNVVMTKSRSAHLLAKIKSAGSLGSHGRLDDWMIGGLRA